MTLTEAREKYVGRMVLTDKADAAMPRSCKWDNPVVVSVVQSNGKLYATTVIFPEIYWYLPLDSLLLPEDYPTHEETV